MLLNMVFNFRQQKLMQKKIFKKFIFTTKTNQWTECSKLKEAVCQKIFYVLQLDLALFKISFRILGKSG